MSNVLGRARTEPRVPRWRGALLLGCTALAACGTSATSSSVRGTSAAPDAAAPRAAAASPSQTVTTTTIPNYGVVLTDAKGFVLYTYTADRPGGPGCQGSCLVLWPPLLLPSGVGQPVSAGVGGLGTLVRPQGVQVTYRNQPLYLYARDRQPGQVTGAGVLDTGGTWLLATVAGAGAGAGGPATTAPTATQLPARRASGGPPGSPPPTGAPLPPPPPASPPAGPPTTRTPPGQAPAPPAPTAPAPVPSPAPPTTAPPPAPAPTAPPTTRPTTVPPGGPSY
jgi:predicted lipoprotein with Yx(FWY)xxD motif